MPNEIEKYRELFNKLNPNDPNYLDYFISLLNQVLIDRNIFVQSSTNQEKRLEFYDVLRDVLSNMNYRNIEFIGCGHSSLTFKIDDQVLKIGKSKVDEKKFKRDFPVLIPLFVDECHQIDEREYYTLQVTPYVDTLDIDKEDVYTTYKRMRDLGYIWNDPTIENTGRIVKDIDYNGHHYKKGDLVIIDLEDIAYVGLDETPDYILEEISLMSYNRDVYNYEMRYIEEKWPKKK